MLLKFKLTRSRAISIGLIYLMGAFTGSVLIASNLQAEEFNDRIIKQEIALSHDLSNFRNLKLIENATKNTGGEVAKPDAPETKNESQPNAVSTALSTPAPTPQSATSKPVKSAPAPATTPTVATSTSTSGGLETASSLTYINSVRASAGKPALLQNSTMDQWALAHAQVLASKCQLYHQNLNGFLGKNIGPKTINSIAENVGYASSTQAVLGVLKNSPSHYANMTGDYQYVGIGVVKATSGSCSGYIYTTQIFAK